MNETQGLPGVRHIIPSMDPQLAEYNVLVGAEGWRHAHWQHTFYPEGLPDEWQLSFYNTQFRCVYLPKSLWTMCSVADAQMWLADTQANFRFILESPDSITPQLTAFLNIVAERALLDDAGHEQQELLWFPPAPDLRALGHRIKAAVEQGRRLYLLNREAHLPSLEQVRSLVEVMGY